MQPPTVDKEVVVRLTLLKPYVAEAAWAAAVRAPQASGVAWTRLKRSVRAFAWRTDAESISGCIAVPESEAHSLLARSGRQGWFARSDAVPFEASRMSWIRRLDHESPVAYLTRACGLADGSLAGLVFRRNGLHTLGLVSTVHDVDVYLSPIPRWRVVVPKS